MKQVRVRLFAAFREAAGLEVTDVRTEAGSVGELFAELVARLDGLWHEPAALVAVNDEMTCWDSAFEDGDEVLFFPPVAGG